MKLIHLISMLIIITLAQGCASTDTKTQFNAQSIYLDDEFHTDKKIVSQQELFAITPQMQAYVESRLLPITDPKQQAVTLIKDLFSPDYMNIKYVHDANYIPADSFENGLANCMSLTLLSYVLVSQTQLKANFMNVEVEENWNVSKTATQINGHVNLELKAPANALHTIYLYGREFTVDFLPMLQTKAKSKKKLSKAQITALFYNNKGADALIAEDRALAYQYFKAASQLAPNLASVWGNLASLYRQAGHLEEAEALYQHAMTLAPNNLNVKENLALLYKKTNREAEANVIYNKIEQARKSNPFYYAMLAEEALYRSEPKVAMGLFKKAIRLERSEHSFYFGLAKAAYLLDQPEDAEKYLRKAVKLTQDKRAKKKYQNKISTLTNIVAKAY